MTPDRQLALLQMFPLTRTPQPQSLCGDSRASDPQPMLLHAQTAEHTVHRSHKHPDTDKSSPSHGPNAKGVTGDRSVTLQSTVAPPAL